MVSNESTGEIDPGTNQSTAYKYQHPADKNRSLNGIDEADVQTVYEVLAALLGDLDSIFIHARTLDPDLASETVGRALRRLAEDDDCPLNVEAWTETRPHQWHIEQSEQRAVADGGLPDHIEEVSTLTNESVYRCITCGCEVKTFGSAQHHPECPEREQRAVTDDDENITIYRAVGSHTGMLHSDDDCHQLQHGAGAVVEKSLAAFPDPEFCGVCGPPEGYERGREPVTDGGRRVHHITIEELWARGEGGETQRRWRASAGEGAHGPVGGATPASALRHLADKMEDADSDADDPDPVTDGGQREKTITGWLVVDWKNETHRTRKSKPSASELGANELLAELRVNVTVPEVETPTLAVNIDVPKPQVEAAELEALDEDELPDWTDAVHERLADSRVNIENVADLDPAERRALENNVALDVLESVPTRPDPAAVREYVYETIERTIEAEEGDAR